MMSDLEYSSRTLKTIEDVLGKPSERCHVPSIPLYTIDPPSLLQPLCQGCLYKLPQGYLLVEDLQLRLHRWGMTEIPSRVLYIHPGASQVQVCCPFIDRVVSSSELTIKSLLNQKADVVRPEQLTKEFLDSISKSQIQVSPSTSLP